MKYCAIFPMLILVGIANGGIVAYEGDVFPEEAGWERWGTMDAERWLDDGCFFQYVELGEWGPPPGGQQDIYHHSLAQFIAADQFFVEWRVYTDGDRSEIPGVAPCSLVAGGNTGVNYHFTIANDQVRLIRDNQLPIVWVDIDPGAPHIYRLELCGAESYVWYIDGQVIDSGVPEGAYPTSESNLLSIRAKSWYLESTTQWEYIRFGTIPEPGTGLLALWGAVLFCTHRLRSA